MISDKKFYTRVLTKDDLNLVPELEEIAFKAQKDPWGTQAIQESFEDSYVLLGLLHYQKVIGFSVIFNTKFTTDLLEICLTPEFQGQHLGQLLLHNTLLKALEIGAKECFLEVRVSNTKAFNLYQKYGFEKVGLRKNYYNSKDGTPGEDAYTMQLPDIESRLALINLQDLNCK